VPPLAHACGCPWRSCRAAGAPVKLECHANLFSFRAQHPVHHKCTRIYHFQTKNNQRNFPLNRLPVPHPFNTSNLNEMKPMSAPPQRKKTLATPMQAISRLPRHFRRTPRIWNFIFFVDLYGCVRLLTQNCLAMITLYPSIKILLRLI